MITLTVTQKRLLPYTEWDRDAAGFPHTAEDRGSYVRRFETEAGALKYLQRRMPMSPERFARVLSRGCEFEPTSNRGALPEAIISLYRVRKDA